MSWLRSSRAPFGCALDQGTDESDADDDNAQVSDAALSAGQYRNFVKENCADPGVFREGQTYLLTCTQSNDVFTSTDLVHWKSTGTPLLSGFANWRKDGTFWAPEIHHFGSKYILLFTGSSKAGVAGGNGRLAIGAALSDEPEGPFKDIGHPLVTHSHGAIDPSLLNDREGRHWLYYKMDGNSDHVRTVIYGRSLEESLAMGPETALFENDQPWEGPIVEAPYPVMHDGEVYLFYSGNGYWGDAYAVGVAKSSHPLGPFVKRAHPILHTNRVFGGPGHNSVTNFGADDFIVYHGYGHDLKDGRHLFVDRIHWTAGWPRVQGDSPSASPQPIPGL